MKKIGWLFIILFYAFTFVHAQKEPDRPYLVVFSFDGFRWDYADSFPTPNLHHIAQQGVHAKSLIPSFPTVTFPNHYTIATGLYPDHHGIINNTFYAPDLRKLYSLRDQEAVQNEKFYGGEPIWVTAKKQNVRSAAYFWVGSEAPIQGIRPDFWKKYSSGGSFDEEIDTVINWLSLPVSQRPHLIMAYFNQPDHLTHGVGPFGTGVKEMVMDMDKLTGIFQKKLNILPIGNKVNFIIVSDHGMEAVSDQKSIVLDSYFSKNWCKHINGHTPIIMIDPVEGYADSILVKLSAAKHLKAWRKQDIPERLHYGSNPRINSLIVLADSAYSIIWSGEKLDIAGNHGYDNVNTDMHGIFYAAGPAFKKGYTQPSFENVNIYSLMANILKLTPVANDGNFSVVKDMLKQP